MEVSECCGSIPWNDSDICAECREHANFIDYVEYNTQVLLKERVLNVTGMIAIGNGEECPYCDLIMEEDFDSIKHVLDCHKKQIVEELFNE